MRNGPIQLGLPTFVRIKGKTELISSMVLSTIVACALITFLPQLMPVWMATATGSRL